MSTVDKIIKEFKKRTKKDCYSINIKENEIPGILDSKIGGIPYIPVGEDFPVDDKGRPMILLIQINFKDVKNKEYPKSGILQVFVNRELCNPCQYKVVYFENIGDYRKDILTFDTDNGICTKTFKIKFKKTAEYVHCSDYKYPLIFAEIIKEVTGEEIKPDDVDKFLESLDDDAHYKLNELSPDSSVLFGYAGFYQGDIRLLKDYANLSENIVRINNLLDDSIFPGWNAMANVLISKEDLISRDFSKAVFYWEP